MASTPMEFDAVIPEETQESLPPAVAAESLDSFQHVEAVMQEEDVSTLGLDSQDWEFVAEMVADTENAATNFMQTPHLLEIKEPAESLADSLKKMEDTMERLKLGPTAVGVETPSMPEGADSVKAAGTMGAAAAGVEAPSLPEGEASVVDAMETAEFEVTQHKWKVFGRGTKTQTYALADVPFAMEPVSKPVKGLVDRLSKEEIYDLFIKFCDLDVIPEVNFGRVVKAYLAMKIQKEHDEVMKQPHVQGRRRPGVGSTDLKENKQIESRTTHQCPECFTAWAPEWATDVEKMCVCGRKVTPIRKTKHLCSMEGKTGTWLLFVTGNGITWVRDGKSEGDAASASGDVSSSSDKEFKLRNAVDIGLLAEAPLCPADHEETSLSDFIQSKDRLQLRTEVLNRVVDAEVFPSSKDARPQISKDCKKDQAALVFHPDAAEALRLAGKLTSADIKPEEAYHPKRPEEEMVKVVQDNADILHDIQTGALSVEDPKGAEALRHLDMVKFKEVLKRKFMEGPGSNQSAWEALNRSMVDLEQARARNKEYEDTRRSYKQFLTPPPGTPGIWGEELQKLIEDGVFCPLTGLRKPNVELEQYEARNEYLKAKHAVLELKHRAFPPKLLTEVPSCQLDMHISAGIPRDDALPMEVKKLEPGSPEAKVALLHHLITLCEGEIRLHAGRWMRYESTEVPEWANQAKPAVELAQALERRTHPSDQGANFLEFHVYTDEDLEDHRRLGLRPSLQHLKGLFFAYEPAPADGGVGICWIKEVQTWTLPTLLGVYGHQFSLKQLWYAWENLPVAVKRHSRGQRGGGAQGARDRITEQKKVKKETMDFLEMMQIPKPTTAEEWRMIWREVGTMLAAKHFISHTPVQVMDLPVASIVDSKEQLRFRAMCDERISFPFEELRQFEDVYKKLAPYVLADSYVEVKVAWRCNTEQWWWAEVEPSKAGALYKKLGYTDDAIRAFGLDPDVPMADVLLGAAASGAAAEGKSPLLMEYPDQPRPPITVENVNSVMGKDSKKKVGGKERHIFWAKTECGLVLSSVTPWEIISKEKGVTTGGYMCKHCQGFWKQGRGATRLVQIIGRSRGKRVSLQLIMDEPPEALYNQWIRDRIEYYKRVEPVAPPRDEQLDLGPPVARIRVSHSNDRGPVGQMIWASILSNRELANLQYIGKVADKHAKRARSTGETTIWEASLPWTATATGVVWDRVTF